MNVDDTQHLFILYIFTDLLWVVALMGGKNLTYQIVYRGYFLEIMHPSQYVSFQRAKECGGGYWLGRTYQDCFWFESGIPQPT